GSKTSAVANAVALMSSPPTIRTLPDASELMKYKVRPRAANWPGVREMLGGGVAVGVAVGLAVAVGVGDRIGVAVLVAGAGDGVAVGVILMSGSPPELEHAAIAAIKHTRAMNSATLFNAPQSRIRQPLSCEPIRRNSRRSR